MGSLHGLGPYAEEFGENYSAAVKTRATAVDTVIATPSALVFQALALEGIGISSRGSKCGTPVR